MALQLAGIKAEIAGMKIIIEASHNASEALKQQAQEALEAHIQNTQDYMDQVTTEPPPIPILCVSTRRKSGGRPAGRQSPVYSLTA